MDKARSEPIPLTKKKQDLFGGIFSFSETLLRLGTFHWVVFKEFGMKIRCFFKNIECICIGLTGAAGKFK